MKRTRMIVGMLLVLMLVLSFTLTACGGNNDATTTAPKPSNNQPTTTTKPTTPAGDLSITVTPPAMEIYAGEYTADDFDLLFGVTVSNSEATLFVSEDEGFDTDTPGTYTITYEAKLGDKTTTATRTITVLDAKSALALEVTHNHLGENKWKGNVLSFPNAMYVELSADSQLSKQSGVFKNTSDKDIVLTVEGTYGCSAIIDANGVVLEGRDGANSKLVNAQNPTRAGSSVTTMTIGEDTVTVSNGFAKNMVIPAGGFAIVVQSSEFGSTSDTDGRGFMNYNVIGSYGNVVRLYWVDNNDVLTPYINQKPTITGISKVLALMGDETFDLNTAILAGLVAKDDNGTFAVDDDITIETISIVNDGGFNINEVGTYTITLSVTDGDLTTEFNREVQVKADGIGTLFIGEHKMNVNLELVAVDKDLASIGNYAFIIYTPNYTGAIEYANGWGEAFVIDKNGILVRVYDGANGKYYDAENPDGIVDASKCTPAGYLTEAFASLQEGETLLVAPNGGDNNIEGSGSRWFLNKYKLIGAEVSGLGVNFKTTSKVIAFGDYAFTAEEGKWLYNEPVTKSQAAGLHMIIYDKNFTGTFETNAYGCAIVLDQYGVLVKIYDGANVGFWTAEGKSTAPLTFNHETYATVAFSELQEGETLIIFPNDGNGNVHRQWALDLRGLKGTVYFGEVATLTGFTFKQKEN